LLALLKRSLTEDEVIKAAQSILKAADGDEPVTADEIRDAIHAVIAKEPNPEEMHQVAARLALVGWPLSAGVR
jgi:2-phospho-L-lactate guanylyltransferase (CobY/MobA/RfbA family)